MTKKEKCARAWIKKKIKSGVSQRELYKSVGIFSNKDKKDVMKEKRLTSKQYDKRYDFLGEVFTLLFNYNFEDR